MNAPRYEKLTVGILFKREAGMMGPRSLCLFYDPMQKAEPMQLQPSCEEYTEETIFGKLSRIGGKQKYPNIEPQTAAELFHRTLRIAGIDAEEPAEIPLRLGLEGKRGHLVRFPIEDLERGRSIFEFLSAMYYNHRNILTSFVNIERARQLNVAQATIVTLGPAVRVTHTERFQPIYLGGTREIDTEKVDKTSIALEFYSASKQHLAQCAEKAAAAKTLSCFPFEGLLAHQVAYTHAAMWDSKDLPRGYRANLIRRGLGGFKTSDFGELVAYSLFPVEMESRLIESLNFLQKISIGPPDLLRDYAALNKRIREVVPDDFFAELTRWE
jgi:hypothetical protein